MNPNTDDGNCGAPALLIRLKPAARACPRATVSHRVDVDLAAVVDGAVAVPGARSARRAHAVHAAERATAGRGARHSFPHAPQFFRSRNGPAAERRAVLRRAHRDSLPMHERTRGSVRTPQRSEACDSRAPHARFVAEARIGLARPGPRTRNKCEQQADRYGSPLPEKVVGTPRRAA